MERRLWTRDELILAFNLYLKLPFGKMHKGNPDVIKLAQLINRTPSSISMRLVNFANIDPYHQKRGISGLSGGVKQCQPIWDEFNSTREDLLFESERILAKLENQSIEQKYSEQTKDLKGLEGKEKTRIFKARVNQYVFRKIILGTYNNKCAITGIDIPELLTASHIIPWAQNKKERLNPSNGICLSKLYDSAFDKGLLGIKSDYSFVLSTRLKDNKSKEYFQNHFSFLLNQKLILPERYSPKKEFLEYHLDTIFLG